MEDNKKETRRREHYAKPAHPDWGVTCFDCERREDILAKERDRADWVYQAASQRLTELRFKVITAEKQHADCQGALDELHAHRQIMQPLRAAKTAAEDALFAAQEQKTTCFCTDLNPHQ